MESTIEKEQYFQANNAEELISALDDKESHIIITKHFREEFEEHTQLPLSETELMGFQLGSRGMAALWSELVFQIINIFSKGSKQQKKIDRKVRNYAYKELDDYEILLYLRQLDY